MNRIEYIVHTGRALEARRAVLIAEEAALDVFTADAIKQLRASPPSKLTRHEALFLAAIDKLETESAHMA